MTIKYTQSQCNDWRANVAAENARRIGRTGQPKIADGAEFSCAAPSPYGQGATKTKIATGRATCRCCQQKIKKGQWALSGYDNNDGSTYAAVSVQIHFNESDCAA